MLNKKYQEASTNSESRTKESKCKIEINVERKFEEKLSFAFRCEFIDTRSCIKYIGGWIVFYNGMRNKKV